MDVAPYLARIGADEDDDLATLTDRHFHAVPFENLSIHLGEEIDTRPEALYDKIVRRRRGGFCYELNGLFAWLLGELGHDVRFLGGVVHTPDGDTAPLAHMALSVPDRATEHADRGSERLVDVGFGGFMVLPTDLDAPSAQLEPQADGDVEVRSPAGKPGYCLERRVRSRADFAPTCFWTATHPDSGFTHGPTCTLPTREGGRVTLAGAKLIRTAPDGTRTEDDLSAGEALSAYRDLFGIALDRLPTPLHPPQAS
ncbi:arylamine N-acetyltransferase family protein [Actinomycetospora termitidis]|uniref:Arylamine N-acetyltransferase n=1 Tax=Actinomycetospora termitidis TaxID=3053470 RepID=A0ABT7M4U8_9PSEU|nr:arylamine N-acetyltransferase [Actinomycetospora sp. Odt1-22]MDL5154468.1 arylamine N-acetyltransferase [Actinomycetospora sp. Odt1-22]